MDNKKLIKDFIYFICDWIENEYKNKGHDGFWYEIKNDKLSYLVNDKGIDKRIQKQLSKRLGVTLRIEYKLIESEYRYPNGELRIKLYREDYSNETIRIKR